VYVPAKLILPPPPPEGIFASLSRPDEDDALSSSGHFVIELDPLDRLLALLPDRPELGAAYGAATVDLGAVVAPLVRLVVTAEAGGGKSTLLAAYASELARAGGRLPLYLTAAPSAAPDPLLALIAAIPELRGAPRPVVADWLTADAAVLLLDVALEGPLLALLAALLTEFPRLPVVVAARPGTWAELRPLGFGPLWVAAWSPEESRDFIRRFGRVWARLFPERLAPDPLLVEGWLGLRPRPPQALTAAVWRAYAGAGPELPPPPEVRLAPPAGDPLGEELLAAGRDLYTRYDGAPDPARRKATLSALRGVLLDELLPLPRRARALVDLALAEEPGLDAVLRRDLAAGDPDLRALAALGLGLLADVRAVAALGELLGRERGWHRAAVARALARIGRGGALERLAAALLGGDDELRHQAAEALALDAAEGPETLLEAAAHAEVLVRRAAVFGLARLNTPSAAAALADLSADPQWIVAEAAKSALARATQEYPIRWGAVLRPLPELHQLPWLIRAVGREGRGVAPGTAAQDALLAALRGGDANARLAALYDLERRGGAAASGELWHTLIGAAIGSSEQTAAYRVALGLRQAGVPLADPEQFGLRA
jgi:HEAT repeat protein